MELWILEARHDLPKANNPWLPEYDKNHAFVVAAETEQRAREMADQNAADENLNGRPWLDERLSTCQKLVPGTQERIIIAEHPAE